MSYLVPSSFLKSFSPKEIHDLKAYFKEFDKERNGYVEIQHLRHLLLKAGEEVQDAEVSQIINNDINLSHHERIEFHEFLSFLNQIKEVRSQHLNDAVTTKSPLVEPPQEDRQEDSNASDSQCMNASTQEEPTKEQQPLNDQLVLNDEKEDVITVEGQDAGSQPQVSEDIDNPIADNINPTSPSFNTPSFIPPPPLCTPPLSPNEATALTTPIYDQEHVGDREEENLEIPIQETEEVQNGGTIHETDHEIEEKRPHGTSEDNRSSDISHGSTVSKDYIEALHNHSSSHGTSSYQPKLHSSHGSVAKGYLSQVKNSKHEKTNKYLEKYKSHAAAAHPAKPIAAGAKSSFATKLQRSTSTASGTSNNFANSSMSTMFRSPQPQSVSSNLLVGGVTRTVFSNVTSPAIVSPLLVQGGQRLVSSTKNVSQLHAVHSNAGGIHSYSEDEKIAFTEHLNHCLASDKDLARVLPIDPHDSGLFDAVGDGVLLCKLINEAVPDTIDTRAMNTKDNLNIYEKTENHNLCIQAAKSIGCSVVNIGPSDLLEGKPILILGLIWQIVKIQLTYTINLKYHPELVRLLNDGESLDEFMKLPADQILLRWMNYHLQKTRYNNTVSNFSKDVSDAHAYSYLLNALSPDLCHLCLETSSEQRAEHVIRNARDALKVDTFIKANDIVKGNPRLNMSFVAQLFNMCPGMTIKEEEIKVVEELFDDLDIGDTREERVFRLWINSQNIEGVEVNHLFSDLKDGIIILKVMDKVQKGIVAWQKVNLNPSNKFRKLENANYCVVIGKQLNFSLVNIGGNDICEGNKKLVLAVIWQLVRFAQLKMLSQLGKDGKEITDSDIIHWANNKVEEKGRSNRQMVTFKDQMLCDSLYLLDIIFAIESRAVNWDVIVVDPNMNEEDKIKNAKYLLSIAKKIGGTVFLTYEDIVEVRPKMIMTFIASLMTVDMNLSKS